jgi:hypothetical protein
MCCRTKAPSHTFRDGTGDVNKPPPFNVARHGGPSLARRHNIDRSNIEEVKELRTKPAKRFYDTRSDVLTGFGGVAMKFIVFSSACRVPRFQTGLINIPVGERVARGDVDEKLITARAVKNHIHYCVIRVCGFNGVMIIGVSFRDRGEI